jgi:hypothetical protein
MGAYPRGLIETSDESGASPARHPILVLPAYSLNAGSLDSDC